MPKPLHPINDPESIFFHIARAESLEDWVKLNTKVHNLLEEAVNKGQEEGTDLDTDPNINWLNGLATATCEVVELRQLAAKMQAPRTR